MFNFLSNIGQKLIEPISGVVSEAVEDKDKANELAQRIKQRVLAFLSAEMEAKRDIIVAEAKSEHWLTANWRPLTMLSFVAMLFVYWFGLAPSYVTSNTEVIEWTMDIIKLGIGGYVVGRSGEKIADKYFQTKKA